MTIAPQIALPIEPVRGRRDPQRVRTVLNFAPIADPEDRTMSRASHIFCMLTNLTEAEIEDLATVDRQLLQEQLERVHRMVIRASIMNDARRAAAFLDELRDGRGRE